MYHSPSATLPAGRAQGRVHGVPGIMKKTKNAKYFVYIARCEDGSFYTGYCGDLKEREQKHNDGKGAKYTRARRPVKIIYSESFSSKSEAMKREAEIKKWNRQKKQELIIAHP